MNYYKKIILLTLLSVFFVACASKNEEIEVVKLLDNATQTWIGQDLPSYPKGKPNITLLKFTVPPKQKLPKHYHSVINVAYMIKGELTVRDEEGNVAVVKAGDPLIELVGKIHYGENTGSDIAELVVFYVNDEAHTPITTKTQD